jgi:hypothetical protein
MAAVVLLVGAAPYRLDDFGADLLTEWIRQLAPDDDAGRAVRALADRMEASEGEPVELGDTEIEGLTAYVIRDYNVQGHDELTALHYALRRYRGDPI